MILLVKSVTGSIFYTCTHTAGIFKWLTVDHLFKVNVDFASSGDKQRPLYTLPVL